VNTGSVHRALTTVREKVPNLLRLYKFKLQKVIVVEFGVMTDVAMAYWLFWKAGKAIIMGKMSRHDSVCIVHVHHHDSFVSTGREQ